LTRPKIEDTNRIGAHIKRGLFPELLKLADKNVKIYRYKLDGFLALNDEPIRSHVAELDDLVIKRMIGHGVGLSKVSKILHTLNPEIIPMIDNLLQEEYRRLYPSWREDNSVQILLDYYINLKLSPNFANLNELHKAVSKNLPGLTKVRVFDIIWWSYLKAQKLTKQKQIRWNTIG
jgi:hypothetical protein